jgi:hypothetical protein
MPKLHDLAWEGNIHELSRVVPGPHFDHLDDNERSVLYCACRSTKTTPEMIQLLIDEKRCSVNHRNGPASFCSTAPHAVVESLGFVIQNMHSIPFTQDDLQLVYRLLAILQLLKSRRADMNIRNALNLTALQQFHQFSAQMSSCASIACLLNDFTESLCSPPPLGQALASASLNARADVVFLDRGNPSHSPPPSQQFSEFNAGMSFPAVSPPPPPAFVPSEVGAAGGAVIHTQFSRQTPLAGSGINETGAQLYFASRSGGNQHAAENRSDSQQNASEEAVIAANLSAEPGSAFSRNDPAPSLPQHASAPVPSLPDAYYEYTLELTTEDYNALILQCIMDPSGSCSAVVACCHRLPSSIQKEVRHGSRILEVLLFNSSHKLIYEFKQMSIPLSQLQTIVNLYSDCHSVTIKFVCGVLPPYVPFNVPDSFSQCCMTVGCMAPLKKGGRHHCRCCGLLFCSKCSDYSLNHPSRGKQRVCKSCHTLFVNDPGAMWRSEWVVSKRQEVFAACCERLTTALDLIEKREHAARLGLDVTRLWSSNDPEYKRQLRMLQRSHPDANVGRDSSSSADFGQLQISCAKLLDRLSAKELLYQSQFASSSHASAIIDNACNVCHQLFSFFSSKHYCRVCGLAVCSRRNCCDPKSTVLPPNFGFGSKPVSVCTVCCSTLLSRLAPSSASSVSLSGSPAFQQQSASTHPHILWRDGGRELFEQLGATQPQITLPCMSELQVACKVDMLNQQTARLTLFFCSSLEKDFAVVKEHLGCLQASVTRPFSSFESFRKCLLNEGYPPYIVPELLSNDVFGCDRFMNAVFQHRRLRNSSLVPLFCLSSNLWDEELHRVLMRVSQGTEATLSCEAVIRSSPLSLPWTAVQELIHVLRSHGIFSLWSPLAIKFFSLSEFLENTKFGLQKLQERTESFRVRSADFEERNKKHETFRIMINDYISKLQACIARSSNRLSREQIRLQTQQSCAQPVLTRRHDDCVERDYDSSQFEIISRSISEEYSHFRSRRKMAQDDRSQNMLIQDASNHALASQSSSNQHVEWIFDALSACKIGSDSIALLQAIKDEEEQLAEMRSLFRTQLHAENKNLVEENQNIQCEIDELCDEEKPNGPIMQMHVLNECLANLQSSLKLEIECCENDFRIRAEKESRLREEMDAVGRLIQHSEDSRKKRVQAREDLEFKMNAASESIRTVVEQLMAQVSLLQQAQVLSGHVEKALHLQLDTQHRESFIVVLQLVKVTFGPEIRSIFSTKDSAHLLFEKRSSLFDEASMILSQVIVHSHMCSCALISL